MKAYVALIISLMLLAACAEKSNYLVKIPPPKQATAQKVDDLEGLTFTPKVDILFVVDDSGSMGTHQTNLSNNISLFTNELSKDQILDYHIGVVSSDMNKADRKGRLYGSPLFVDRSTLPSLQRNLLVGTSGAGTEQLFGPIMAALSAPLVTEFNAGFYRPDAHLAIVFITDAEDQTPSGVDYFVEFLERLKNGDKSKIVMYGVHIPTGVPNCNRDTGPSPPVRLEQALDAYSAIEFSLCDPDYGTKLAGLGANLSKRVGSFIPLGQAPDVNTITVTYGTQNIPQHDKKGWVYLSDRVGLLLGPELELSEQPKGTELKVDFVPADDK